MGAALGTGAGIAGKGICRVSPYAGRTGTLRG